MMTDVTETTFRSGEDGMHADRRSMRDVAEESRHRREGQPGPGRTWTAGRVLRVLGSVAGFALHGVAGVFVAASGLLMPMWAIVAMEATWIVGAVIAVRHRARPLVVLAVPVATFVIWYTTASLGEAFLGWTG